MNHAEIAITTRCSYVREMIISTHKKFNVYIPKFGPLKFIWFG